MKIIVKPHNIQIISTPVNELEINVTKCYFEFSEEITNDFVKEAYFTLGDSTYKKIIVNNECDIPNEVLTEVGTIKLGVVAYLVENEQEIIRYTPTPGYFTSWEGSLQDAENSEPITPSEMEQYEQALQEGLAEVDERLTDANTVILEASNLNISGQKVDNTTTITITDRQGEASTFTVSDGVDGVDGRNGVDGKDGIDGKDGQDGTNGVDGFSPTASVSKSGNVATISITDKNGTTTTTISDGINGTNGTDGRDGYVQYTAGDNITIENNVISATVQSNPYQKTVYNLALTTRLSATSNYTYYTNFTSDELTLVSNIITDAKQKGYGDIIIYCNTDNYSQEAFPLFMPKYSNSIGAKETFLNYLATGVVDNRYSTSSSNKIISAQLVIQGSWSGDVFTASKIIFYNVIYDFLSKENTGTYNPTANSYNPATTKYVDTAISNKIWIGTQTEYDNLSTYNENTLYFIKEDTNAS